MKIIHDELLKKIFLIIIGACALGILAANLFLFPTFKKMLIKHTEADAVMVGAHLAFMLFPEGSSQQELDISPAMHHLKKLIDDFSLYKLKIFNSNGVTLYSTDAEDIGVANDYEYFHNQVAQGKVYTKTVHKDSTTLEQERLTIDVVETYVPIMRENKFLGALEIYYDITDEINTGRLAIVICNILTIAFLMAFLWTAFLVGRKLDSHISDREAARAFLKMTNIELKEEIENRIKAEQEKERLIIELEKTLLELKTLKGLVPICSFCKNIRNDTGSWERMEEYIENHSDAEFSHGLCPACAAKHYPDLHLDEDDNNTNT